MGRTTIRDIAKAAGVSTATVDRALNGRAGVRAASRQRVLRVARDLGYLPSEGMVILPSRPAHLEFVVPSDRNRFMLDLVERLESFAAALPLVGTCRVIRYEGFGPDALVPALEQVSLDAEGVGLVGTQDPRTIEAIAALAGSGVRVVTISSDVPGSARSAYVGVDNRAAGRTAADLMGLALARGGGPVAVFPGTMGYHGHSEREAGFRDVIETRYPAIQLMPSVETGEDSTRSCREMARLLREGTPPRGIYCIGAGRAGIVEALREAPPRQAPFIVMHDLIDATARWLRTGAIGAVIDQNARLVAEQSVIRLLGSIATATPLLPFADIEPRIYLRENLPPR